LQFTGSQATLYDITANVIMFVIDNKHAPSLASECGELANKVVVVVNENDAFWSFTEEYRFANPGHQSSHCLTFVFHLIFFF
jgi:hypothetical protein